MKGLGPRAYNILFHTHTVSGIVISLVLFIIFFAGAISLYKQEIYQWENPAARITVIDNIDYERMITRLDSVKTGIKEADEVRVVLPTEARPVYTIYAPVTDSTGTHFTTFVYNPRTDHITELFHGDGTTTGDTLYRLHFLDQVPWYIGRYIAGFVSLFFAFAVVAGVLIHWKNIIPKFYAFSFKQIKKQFWTNAHTIFGIIGLPFQLMYAITGAFYMLSVFILAPAVLVLFKGDQDKLVTKIFPTEAFHAHDSVDHSAVHMPIAKGLRQIRSDYPEYQLSYLEIINPGRENAALGADLVDKKTFNKDGTVVLDLHSGDYKLQIKPGEKNYTQSVLTGINKVHFAAFGGWMMKALYFILSMFSCFVIISGVLMWKEARNKPTYSDRQRRFHHRVTVVYLAVCFSLFPATALLFIAEQLVPVGSGHASSVNTLFFLSWLLFATVGYLRKTEKHITIYCLVLGGALACIIPFANGFNTGDWLWITAFHHPYVFITDTLWFITGAMTLTFAYLMGKNRFGIRNKQ
ncbi:PepSY domain-containing protein [Sphingobacterium sp. JB170]|uniref:PepSY-associated TM helix domain-containing protein n=1 Tax=Sphingobacterium sp. JB170 TaxID=1434842 RepID=UPI00097EF180|nr:PepSY-associated TM helix domain-containing protein [Sphingobacterium sp. JB170]SJN23047.1 putative iron-regulated membrane protein [Sphingobacterium sp. JB170]